MAGLIPDYERRLRDFYLSWADLCRSLPPATLYFMGMTDTCTRDAEPTSTGIVLGTRHSLTCHVL